MNAVSLPCRVVISRMLMTLFFVAAIAVKPGAMAAPDIVATADWAGRFVHEYDYVLRETEGLARENEPVEITLTMAGDAPDLWRDHIRVVALTDGDNGFLTPHQVMGETRAGGVEQPDGNTPHPATSINIIFLANCPARGEVMYRLFWGNPESAAAAPLPSAALVDGLRITGEAPGLTVENNAYHIELDPGSGAIRRIRTTFQSNDTEMFYKKIPIHFGTDIWSPGQSWDHDYDWPKPPHQKVEGGPLALRYHRWGPMQRYSDVEISITYTFYAHVPYVHVSSTMRIMQDRSSHAIRMGEIVVSHSRRPSANPDPEQEESPEVFTHYGWPDSDGNVVQREINAYRNELGQASVEARVPGGLAVLDRDIPWVAGYNMDEHFGLATLRKNQFAGNYLGRPTPQSAPCTYLGQYGWGFVYWSRPMVYPLGTANSLLDLNTAVAAGTFFGTEEALLTFKPSKSLDAVRTAHRKFTIPLRLEFKGTGPW
ncbi:MAG: hypothetical protein L3K26_12535 [Candidatus Hydrogenedentes bacterium]|nr:hypothetical protein [Candidatus Hydrogenedentota bacterium]